MNGHLNVKEKTNCYSARCCTVLSISAPCHLGLQNLTLKVWAYICRQRRINPRSINLAMSIVKHYDT